MDSLLWPRVIGLSECAWTSKENRRKGPELDNLATNILREWFDRMGWDYYIAEKFDIMSDPAKNEEVLASE